MISSRLGKRIPLRIPIFRLSPAMPETKPTSEGPLLHPRSPARARKANIAVPPEGIFLEARLKAPGHMTPTESPHSAHPIRLSSGAGDKAVKR